MMKWDSMFQKLPAGYIRDLGGAWGSHLEADHQQVNSHQQTVGQKTVERPEGETTLRTQVTSHKIWLSDLEKPGGKVPVVWGLLQGPEGLDTYSKKL